MKQALDYYRNRRKVEMGIPNVINKKTLQNVSYRGKNRDEQQRRRIDGQNYNSVFAPAAHTR